MMPGVWRCLSYLHFPLLQRLINVTQVNFGNLCNSFSLIMQLKANSATHANFGNLRQPRQLIQPHHATLATSYNLWQPQATHLSSSCNFRQPQQLKLKQIQASVTQEPCATSCNSGIGNSGIGNCIQYMIIFYQRDDCLLQPWLQFLLILYYQQKYIFVRFLLQKQRLSYMYHMDQLICQ